MPAIIRLKKAIKGSNRLYKAQKVVFGNLARRHKMTISGRLWAFGQKMVETEGKSGFGSFLCHLARKWRNDDFGSFTVIWPINDGSEVKSRFRVVYGHLA